MTDLFDTTPVSVFNLAPSLRHAALAYAAVGIPVFPLQPGDKQPIVKGGFQSATTNAFQIHQWWHKNRTPLPNIGVPCGDPSGWWVVDIDPRHGGLESLLRLQRDLERTLPREALLSLLYGTRRQLSGGGGVHLFFRQREDITLATTTRWAGYEGIDMRAAHSYIVVAPSILAQGKVYQWQNEAPLSLFPDALATLRKTPRRHIANAWSPSAKNQPQQFSQRTTHDHAGKPPYCGHPPCYLEYATTESRATWGRRHNFALYLSHRLIDEVGMDGEKAAGWLCAFAAAVRDEGEEPFEEKEALDCLDYVIREAQQAA